MSRPKVLRLSPNSGSSRDLEYLHYWTLNEQSVLSIRISDVGGKGGLNLSNYGNAKMCISRFGNLLNIKACGLDFVSSSLTNHEPVAVWLNMCWSRFVLQQLKLKLTNQNLTDVLLMFCCQIPQGQRSRRAHASAAGSRFSRT